MEALADDEVVDGPVYVTINVLDINNNAPYFNQSEYTAVVRENNPAGEFYKRETPPMQNYQWHSGSRYIVYSGHRTVSMDVQVVHT